MRHRYDTRGIILARSPLGEASAVVTVLSPELGLVRARAQGLRRSGAKLSAALATFSESSLILVRGKEGWRVAGAVLDRNWLKALPTEARPFAARIAGLLVRLAPSDAKDEALFPAFRGYLETLGACAASLYEAAEILAALRALVILGFDNGADLPPLSDLSKRHLERIQSERASYVARVNRGIAASEL
ncbi:MAG TPA: recombination protein O N-terminal domain-containing protein [Candidatus Paceibacterota bacterium]|nr:recombination protein O N-terminal domain-containing protein [Candidatus Paceibacterota bacterium]